MDQQPNHSDLQKLDLSDQDWEQYVQRVSQKPQTQTTYRSATRYKKIVQCLLRVNDQGCGNVYVIHCRDIGSGGIGFMHNEPLAHNAGCTIVLETNNGHGQIVNGQVRWCREVGGGMHAVGVVFDQPLDLSDFVDVDPSGEASAA